MMKTISAMLLAFAMLAGTAMGFAQDKMNNNSASHGNKGEVSTANPKPKHKKIKKMKSKSKMEKGKMDDKMKTGNGKM